MTTYKLFDSSNAAKRILLITLVFPLLNHRIVNARQKCSNTRLSMA